MSASEAVQPIVRSRGGRLCAVCQESHPTSSPSCSKEIEARSWVSCPACSGTGWDSTGMDIWCRECGGARVLEG